MVTPGHVSLMRQGFCRMSCFGPGYGLFAAATAPVTLAQMLLVKVKGSNIPNRCPYL